VDRHCALELGAYELARRGLSDWHLELADTPPTRDLAGWSVLGGPRVIYVSSAFVDESPMVLVREIVLHELAHVLSGDPTHGYNWRESARHVGCVTAETWPGPEQ
jgi:hypothetical protein